MKYDIYITGVGGQGVLTIADILTTAAFKKGLPVNYYPTKGMAQRGGFVKAQLRFGETGVGPDIPEGGADLLIAMELSESLKGARYLKAGGDCFLYENRWLPAAVMLGKAPYPSLSEVWGELEKAGAHVHCLSAESLPVYQGNPVRDNIYVLGGLMASTTLSNVFTAQELLGVMEEKWPKGVQANRFAFEEGLKAPVRTAL